MTDLTRLDSLQSVALPGPSHDVWTHAAVRETFRPDALLTDWLLSHPHTSRQQQQEALRAVVELQSICVESIDARGREALRLPGEARRSVLSRVGAAGSLHALAGVPSAERTLAENTLADLLAQVPVAVDRDDRVKLSALQQASDWALAAGVQPTVDPLDLARDLQRIEFLQMLGGNDLHRFVGRGGLRRLLGSAWRDLRGVQSFYIEGPGGIGKSLAVCRFVADLLESQDAAVRPDVVFHLDFDRLSLQLARESTVLLELVQQSARWCAPAQHSELVELTQEIGTGDAGVDSPSLGTRSSESRRDSTNLLGRLMRLWPRAGKAPRLIVFVDSFEQVESFDDVAANTPGRMLQDLRTLGAQVLAIYASRAFTDRHIADGSPRLRLQQFSVREADTYLRNEAARVGIEVDPASLAQVRAAVGRSPLALRLAVTLLEQADDSFDPRHWGQMARESPEIVQAALYDRLLRRIREPRLRQLAVPGLLVRRLTVEVIEQVLAEPCGLDLSPGDAARLLSLAQKEGQLFVRDETHVQALRHRQDVRATMLHNIERSTDRRVARVINENAVRYYERIGANGPVTWRVEELYHRLRLDQPDDQLDARWSDEAGKLLRPAMQELPPRARAYLRRKLGGASLASSGSVDMLQERSSPPGPARKNEAVPDEVREFRLVASKELQAGAPVSFILERWAAEGHRLDVPLGDIYANALLREGRHEELLACARDVMTASRLDPAVRCGVLSIAAGALEGRGLLRDAHSFWVHALQAADKGEDPYVTLACLVGCIRIRRKLASAPRRRQVDLLRAAELLDRLGSGIYDRRVLAREAAAELGELLHDRDTRQSRQAQQIFRLITFLIEVNEALPSAVNNPARLGDLSDMLFGSAASPSLRFSNSALQKRVYETTFGTGEGLDSVIHLLREEVDWTLAQAAGRPG